MKILPLAASAATIVMLGACSGSPVGLDPSAPSFDIATTSTTTAGDSTSTTTPVDSTSTTTPVDSTSSTCTTTSTTPATSTSTSASTGTQLSASGTYAVAYGGAVFVVGCTGAR